MVAFKTHHGITNYSKYHEYTYVEAVSEIKLPVLHFQCSINKNKIAFTVSPPEKLNTFWPRKLINIYV